MHILLLIYDLNIALKELFLMLFPNRIEIKRPNNLNECGMPSCHAMIFTYLLYTIPTMPLIAKIFCYKQIFDRYIYGHHTILQLLIGTGFGLLVSLLIIK